MKKYLSIVVLATLLTGSRCFGGDDWGPRVSATTVDLFIARPFTFAATIAGGALWFITLPITLPTKTHKEALEVMVKTPCELTFRRDLGYFAE
ncbi:MAG TPA: hypothetical protein VGF13_10505 [Verrucomicrobiae bacterium]|jgi:hypothetical protein